MRGVLDALAEDLRSRGGFDLEEAYIDGSFAPAKKGAPAWAKPNAARGPRSWQWPTVMVFPSLFARESATPHEVKLVQQTLAEIFVEEPIRRLIGDNAYDSDKLDRELAETGVEMIAPHRSNRTNRTQDGQPLASLSSPMEGRAVVCVAPEFSPTGYAVRSIPSTTSPVMVRSRLRPDPAPPFLR